MCNFKIDVPRIESQHGIRFADYFARELSELADGAARDGFVHLGGASVEVTPVGRMFVRNVAMVFDRHLREKANDTRPVFSRTV
jgi:oxygen-independent coproporphyrinogen-3 oxidase